MPRFTLAAAALALGVLTAGGAMAAQCPKIMAEVDAKLAENPALSSDQMAEVMKLRADGEALHKAGKHQESVDSLAKAKAILGIQ